MRAVRGLGRLGQGRGDQAAGRADGSPPCARRAVRGADSGREAHEIVELERSLALEGTILVKFFLHISDAEQLRRFERRAKDPLKRWKLTDDDWRNREKRPEYARAIEDMLARTDHELARWQLVEAESKRYARVKVLETTVAEIERGMRERGFEVPPELDGLLSDS